MKFFYSFFFFLASCTCLNAQNPVQTIENTHAGKLVGFDINEDGTLLITGGVDNRAHLWNTETAERLKSFMDNQAFSAVEFSYDKTKIVTSNSNGKVILWDASSLKPVAILKGNMLAIVSFAFHPNNRIISGISEDGKLYVWDENAKLIKSLETADNNNKDFKREGKGVSRVFYSYDGTTLITLSNNKVSIWGADSYARIKDAEYGKLTINDIDVAHNVKDIALAVSNGTVRVCSAESMEEVDEIPLQNEKIMSVSFSADDKFLAVGCQSGNVIIINRETKKDIFSVKNAHEDVSKVLFTGNGSKLFTSSAEGTIKIWDISNLGIAANGSSTLVATESNTSSQHSGLEYRGGDPLKGLGVSYTGKDLQFGKYYALIIGIDSYKGTWPSLKNAVNDAKELERVLQGKYKFDYFKSLYNDQATRVNIIKEMEWLVENVKSTDNLLIFYSGHGEYNQQLNKGYWVPADALNKSIASYISNSDIQTFLGGIRSKHTLLISDACFSGDIFRGDTKTIPFEESDKYYAKVNNVLSRKAITSGGIEPVLDGGKNGHSVFSYYLLKVLDNNDKKYLVSSQLYEEIKIPVINNSEQSPLFNAIKNAGDEGGEFIFVKK